MMTTVRMKVVSVSAVDEKENVEDIVDIIEFEDFHDAWVWIRDNREVYCKLSNPTMELEIKEIPTEERAERLYRYACNILED